MTTNSHRLRWGARVMGEGPAVTTAIFAANRQALAKGAG